MINRIRRRLAGLVRRVALVLTLGRVGLKRTADQADGALANDTRPAATARDKR